MAVPVGAIDSTVPSSVTSGTASTDTFTFWFGPVVAASDSLNGTTTWNASMLSSTRNWVPPGRAGLAPTPAAACAADAESTPGMPALLPGARALVPLLGPRYSPTTPLM